MPLPHTVIDLWRMVYEHNCATVVMLNPWDDNDPVFLFLLQHCVINLKRSAQVQYNYNNVTQKFCCIAAVRTGAIQLQYKFRTTACKFSTSFIAALYCSGPHKCSTPAIQGKSSCIVVALYCIKSCIVVVLQLCGPLNYFMYSIQYCFRYGCLFQPRPWAMPHPSSTFHHNQFVTFCIV